MFTDLGSGCASAEPIVSKSVLIAAVSILRHQLHILSSVIVTPSQLQYLSRVSS
jgi:hypothetical protein